MKHKHRRNVFKYKPCVEALKKPKDTVPSREEDFMSHHFGEYAAHRPNVH